MKLGVKDLSIAKKRAGVIDDSVVEAEAETQTVCAPEKEALMQIF